MSILPNEDDPTWDVLSRLSGRTVAHCIAKMGPLLAVRHGHDPFDKQIGSEQTRSLEEKVCEMAVRCLFLSPGAEYTSQRAHDVMALHGDKLVGHFHDMWKARGWIMHSKIREYSRENPQIGQDRPKFALTKRMRSNIFGRSSALYRWWIFLRHTMEMQVDGDTTWPYVNGEMMFVMSENFCGDSTMEFLWDDQFDTDDWKTQKQKELKDFIDQFTEDTIIMDEYAIDKVGAFSTVE